MIAPKLSYTGLVSLGLLLKGCVSLPAHDSSEPKERRSIDNGIPLRILPLGDSITWGYQSTDGNGWRLDLQDLLNGNPVEYVGSQQSGNMADNSNEGHPGAVIDEIATYAKASLPERPNVIVLMAGTNDMNQPNNPATAPARWSSLLDECIAACPDATLIVAQLTPIGNAGGETLVEVFNAALPAIVQSEVAAGHKVVLVDMSASLTAADLIDGLHPTDAGYNKMAQVWFKGFQMAASKGWITSPVEVNTGSTTTSHACGANPVWNPTHGQIASGVGNGDAAFTSSWNHVGVVAGGFVGSGSNQGAGVRLADINGDGIDDYVWVDPKSGALTVDFNPGIVGDKIDWQPKGILASGIGDGAGVMFADLNGDGLDDYLWVAPSGDVTAYKNGGPGAGGWIWKPLGTIITGTGGSRSTTRFADIDGDGRADYFIVDSAGGLTGWLNTGMDDAVTWTSLGSVATGVGDTAGVHLEDINGDGRADYLWLDKSGALTVYINNRGAAKGLAPAWVSAGQIASGVGTSRDNITFGDMNGDGKKDYVFAHSDTGALDVWVITASGGAYDVGDGVIFADLDGDGRDDYVFMNENGAVTLYVNKGLDAQQNTYIWIPHEEIASGIAARKDVRLADLDGDGLDDYLVVDEKTGAFNMGQVATGIGEGEGVKFADINGDGMVDYLWVDPSGAVTAYINGGSGGPTGWIWRSQGMIATGVGAAREDVHFADLNGDGKADYVWVNRLDGSVKSWTNGGPAASAPGGWLWISQGTVATGIGSNGLVVHFANTAGQGRADYLTVDPVTGAVKQWQNDCPGGSPGTPTSGTSSTASKSSSPTSASTQSGYYFGGTFLEHSSGYVPNSDGTQSGTRDWCQNVQLADQPQGGYPVEASKGANDLGWMSVSCSIPEVVNTGLKYTARQRWEVSHLEDMREREVLTKAQAADAMNALLAFRICWKTEEQANALIEKQSWSQGLFNYFHGPDNQHCELYQHGCDEYQKCSEEGHAAGFLVLNSFVTLHNIQDRFYQAIDDIWQTEVTTNLAACITTFSPTIVIDQSTSLKVLLDFISLGFAMAAGPFWEAGFARIGGKTNTAGAGKNTNEVVIVGTQTAKYWVKPAITQSQALENLGLIAKSIKDVWQQASVASLQALFSPEQANWETFTNIVADGGAIEDLDLDPSIATTAITGALWGTLIPFAWSLSNEKIHPFILIPDDIDSTVGCKPPSDIGKYISSSHQAIAGNCVGSFMYYLLAVTEDCNVCDLKTCLSLPSNENKICYQGLFTLPPGLDQLVPEQNMWGNVTRDAMVQGSLASWRANGQQNGGSINSTDPNILTEVVAKGLKGPGLFNFPVCTMTEVMANLNKKNAKKNPNYPCNPS
ncbi:hypothetical protein G7046_g2578 [Stylonectria norvegica]|nr:hypothetical protein G7046_g2578 [Stylonectria norvegica]